MNSSALSVILELGPKYGVDLWKHVQYRSHEDAAWRDCISLEMFDICDDDYYRVKPHTHYPHMRPEAE